MTSEEKTILLSIIAIVLSILVLLSRTWQLP